ncbi:hypothetical protein BU25DRAFT_245577 [Macroventuria anomochaeta]|uniref:Uncharacterized protein n=1 Tax=Macroventuria anomochaeta TaxID=301207 RepID=A0ACB6S9G9_9PLEO|nr:uncharacterized protein BU25DRAFT_245577 [Macroventuria anomochaeta]KAF2630693.1 hypothetical protein BU25DRAFT_245577 [Macroventuria anomochaeta]
MGSVSNSTVTESLSTSFEHDHRLRLRAYFLRHHYDIPFYCLLLVPNVHISVLLLSIFQRDTSGVWAHWAHFTGISMHLGKDQGAWCLHGVFLQVRQIHSRATTHERDRSIEHRLCFSARLNSQDSHFRSLCNSCAAVASARHSEHTCVTTSTVSLTPLIMACQARTVCSTCIGDPSNKAPF